MSTYREIIGKKIKKVSSDPSSGLDGEMWYNSTTGTLRGLALVQAWSSGTSLPETRAFGGGCGTQTAALQAGGFAQTPTASVTTSFEYNGVGWADGGALPAARRNNSMFGIQTAAVSTGTSPVASNVDTYNGTSWTAGTAYPIAAMDIGVAGTQTAGVAWSGNTDPGSSNTTNEYNGSWTASNVFPANSSASGSLGTQTAAVSIGGLSPGDVNTTFEYDGSSWSAGGTYPIAVSHSGGAGTQAAGLGFGGYLVPGVTTVTNSYDGTSWTASAAMGTGRYMMTQGLGATNTAALAVGGSTPTRISNVEEFNSSTTAYTPGAWAAGGALNTGRMNVSCGGTQTASILVGGHISPGGTPSGVELYDGSSWTTSGTVPYTADYGVYAGTSTSGIQIGGAPYTTTSAELSGTSWTAGGSLNTGRSQLMGAGTQTAGLAFGGYTDATTETAVTEEYNGTAFSNSPNSMSLARGRGAGFGIQTAALCVAGNATPSETISAATEEYNGTSWTAGGNYVVATGSFIGGFGTQTDGTAVGGGTPSYVATAAGYDGTAWSTRPSAAYAAGRTQTAGANGSAGLRAGGGPNTSQRDGSEEFTGETSSANIEDFTTS